MIFIKFSLAFGLFISVTNAFAQVEPENAAYNKMEQSRSMSKTKIIDAKAGLKGLIKSMKAKVPVLDEEGKDVTVERILSTHKDLKKAILNYNRKTKEMDYKFPEKGSMSERKYMPLRVQSLEEIEEEIGIDGILTKLKKRVEKKYQSFEPEQTDESQRKRVRRKAKLNSKAKEKDKSYKLER